MSRERGSLHALILRAARAIPPSILLLLAYAPNASADATDQNRLDFTVNVNLNDLHIEEDGIWHQLRIDQGHLDTDPDHLGQPQLPLMNAFFILPPNKAVQRISITPRIRISVPGEYLPYPILDDREDTDPPDEPPWDTVIYPEQTVFSVKYGDSRNYNLLKVTYYPLEYNAGSQELTLLGTQDVAVTLRDRTALEEEASVRVLRPEAIDGPFRSHRKWVAQIVRNPEDLDRFYPRYEDDDQGEDQDEQQPRRATREQNPYGTFVSDLPSLDGLGVPFIIITNNRDEYGNNIGDMVGAFSQLSEVTTAWGLVTVVKTIDWIEAQPRYTAYDRPEAIRRFLQDAFALWGVGFVLLGGDESVVPTRRIGLPSAEINDDLNRPDPPADFWYTRFGITGWVESWNADGDSWIGESMTDVAYNNQYTDIYLGRLPARNSDEATTMVTKTLRYRLIGDYEDQAADDDFYTSLLVAAGPLHNCKVDAASGIVAAETNFAGPFANAGWDVTRLYPEVGSVTCPGDLRCFAALDDYIDAHAAPGVRWSGANLRDELNSGYHLVFHNEHSNRTRWGMPTAHAATADDDCPDTLSYLSDCEGSLSALFGGIEHLDQNEVLSLQNGAGQEGRFCIAMSGGSWTNMMDMDAIGESFLRSPSGGAIAYVGNTETFAAYRENVLGDAAEYMLHPFYDFSISQSVFYAIDYNSSGNAEFKLYIGLPLLGDPAIWAWRGPPARATLNVSPNPIASVGQQTITITATDSTTSGAIADGIVCVRQGTTTYATGLTNSNGVASFRGILIQDASDSVIVTFLKPGYLPELQAVAVTASAPFISYESHELDDCTEDGDCDGVVEAGETVSVEVTLRNTGSSSSQQGSAILLASPPFDCQLDINGEYRPADILIGAKSAHPSDASKDFTVPLSRMGIRLEGQPLTLGVTSETFKVWRVEGTGSYTIGTVSPSASADSVFTGVLKGRADFSNVSITGEGNDSYFWSGDSIWFQFHGDATEDRISFKAEAPNWIGISTPTATIPGLASGDSIVVEYPIELEPEIPDAQNLVFTISAYQSQSTAFFHSDFAVSVAKPEIDVVIDSTAFGDFGCGDTSLVWRPLIYNRGSGAADSVRVTLRITSGSMTVLDSVVTFSEIEPDSFATSTSFVLCGDSVADTVGLEPTIQTEVFHMGPLYEIVDIPDNPCPPPAPENLRVDLIDGTAVLRWDPIANVQAHLIECAHSENGGTIWRDLIGSNTTRYEARGGLLYRPSGPGGYDHHYYFRVRGARSRTVDDHNYLVYGARATVGPVYLWPKERHGWPKLVPESSICAPTVASLGTGQDEGTVIFAAGARIYAWRENGEPLDPDAPSGLFFDPIGGSTLPADKRFTSALAFASMWREPNSEETGLFLAGNLRREGVELVEITRNDSDECCVASLYNEYPFFSNLSPVIADTVSPYTTAGTYASVLWLPGMSDYYINGIVVDDDLTPYGDANYHFAVTYPSGSRHNYEALALGYNTATGLTEVIATSRGVDWKRGWVACYSTDSARPATAEWADSLDTRDWVYKKNQWFSIPAVGDVDGDGDNDVVVMTLWRCLNGSCSSLLAGKIFIIDENTGSVLPCDGCEDTNFHFLREKTDFPPAGPTLADLDNDGDMEILIAGNTSDGDYGQEYPVTLRLDILDYDVDNETLLDVYATQDIPFTQRNEEQGNVNGNSVSRGGAVYPIGSPVVAEVDYSGECKPDIFVSTSVGAIYGFEYHVDENSLESKTGWPLLLPDVPREPVLAVLDPDDPTQYSMVVQCQDGWVHVFDMARPSETVGSCGVDWPSFGGDLGNTRGKLSYSEAGRDAPPQVAYPNTRIAGVFPVPGAAGQDVVLELSRRTSISLKLFDITGRRVATIQEGPLDPGRHRIHWDGRSGGRPVASGVYWYRLTWDSGSETRRVTIVR